MTKRMTSLDLFEKLDGLNDLYIAEGEIPEAHLSATVLPAPRPKRKFSRVLNSGWGVAIVCALVAVSVMGGIIWAGFHADDPSPVGSQLTEDLTFEQETLEDIDPPAAEIAAKAPRFGWEASVKSVQTTAFYSPVTYDLLTTGEYHVTEISLATHADDTRTLMFRLINRETYEVMARYTWDATEGKWGVMEMGGAFAVYHTTEKGEMTTIQFDFFMWMPELDPATYECVGTFHPTILPEESGSYLWKQPRVEDTREWSQFVRKFFTDYPAAYLCMDEALGDLAFYTEDNRYTDGWARMRLFWQDLYILDSEETASGLEIVTENAAGESLDIVYHVPKQGTIVILDFRPDHTVKVTVQNDVTSPHDGWEWDISDSFTGTYHLSDGFITLDCPEAAEVYLSNVRLNGTFLFTECDHDVCDGGVWIGDAHFMSTNEHDLEFLGYSRN